MAGRIFYAQSGGVTAVINASAAGVVAEALKQGVEVVAGRSGILGALREELYDLSSFTAEDVQSLRNLPGGAFGSCRYKLADPSKDDRQYRRLMSVFEAHDVRYFLYNGGGDSQDTSAKVEAFARAHGQDLVCVGIPKTVDNDLMHTDCCPGFGSAAKYIAVSVREAALDVASMCETSTKVFILEVMGRHAGWLAAAGGLAGANPSEPPHIILFPEIAFEEERFLKAVEESVARYGYCVVVASEGAKDSAGDLLSTAGGVDSFGHSQLGGLAPKLGQMVQTKLGLKHHWAVADYLQRSARHMASATDLEQAYSLGQSAAQHALRGEGGVMCALKRLSDDPYRWDIETVPLADVANAERMMPPDFISADGWGITDKARTYLTSLIQGEAFPRYHKGLPDYRLRPLQLREKKLASWQD